MIKIKQKNPIVITKRVIKIIEDGIININPHHPKSIISRMYDKRDRKRYKM